MLLDVAALVGDEMAIARFAATERAEGASEDVGEGVGEWDVMEACRGECGDGGGEGLSESDPEDDEDVLCSG